MQERAKRRATTGPAAGFDESRPGVPPPRERGRSSRTTNVLTPFYLDFNLEELGVDFNLDNFDM